MLENDLPYKSLGGGPRVSGRRVLFRRVVLATLALPLGGFCFCVGWSLLYNFEKATSTHCEVTNYLPSISATIGSFRVQRRVWKVAIAMHAPFRFLFGYFYREYWQETLALTSGVRLLLLLTQVLYVSENLGLIGLSFVASIDNFPFHKTCFIVFLACGELYMLCTCRLFRLPRQQRLTRRELVSRRCKLGIFIFNIVSLAFCMYFYARHNAHCEPYVYTLFAFSEYCVVLSNMAFHATAYWDFYELVVDLSTFTTL